jgi:putative oxidoreductase
MHKFLSSGPLHQDLGLLIVRVITGLFMVYHGWEVFDAETMHGYTTWDAFKNPWGGTMVYVGKGAELVAGLMLTLGLFTRLSAIMLFVSMWYIAFFIGSGKVWYEDQHPFMFVLLAIVYFVAGGGRWSLDRKWFG